MISRPLCEGWVLPSMMTSNVAGSEWLRLGEGRKGAGIARVRTKSTVFVYWAIFISILDIVGWSLTLVYVFRHWEVSRVVETLKLR